MTEQTPPIAPKRTKNPPKFRAPTPPPQISDKKGQRVYERGSLLGEVMSELTLGRICQVLQRYRRSWISIRRQSRLQSFTQDHQAAPETFV